MIKNILTGITFLLLGSNLFAQGTFNSTGASTDFSNATAWTLTGGSDADGIPDINDDVTILNGHTIGLTVANSFAKSITINVGGTFQNANRAIILAGNFTNNGTFSGPGRMSFQNCTATISSATTLNFSTVANTGIISLINATVNQAVGTTINLATGELDIFTGSTYNNNGTVNVRLLKTSGSNNHLNNNAASTILLVSNYTPVAALSISNNITSNFILFNSITQIPNLTYGNLILQGSGTTKAALGVVTINGNLTNNSGVTMNMASFTLNLGGNVSNSGTLSNIAAVNFTGTTNQTVASPQVHNITVLTSTNTNTIILNSGTYNISTSASFLGNLNINAGGVTLNMNSNPFTLTGNLTNIGVMSNLNAFNLNGTTTQNISSTTALSIPVLNSTNTATVNITNGTYTIGTSATFTRNLTLNGASVVFNLNSKPLTIGGNLTNTSGTISNAAAVTCNGVTAQTISFVNDQAFTDFTASNAAGVSITTGNHTISGVLTVNSGMLTVNANKITLLSDAAKTASIGQSTGTISGSMIVQRFVSGRPTNYHDFSPVVASTTIDDWDDELYMSIGAPNNAPGYAGGDGSAGGSYSVFTYNPAAQTYNRVLTGTTLSVGKGYDVYLGDDAVTWPGRAFDTRGVPNMGTVNVAVSSAGDHYNLVGNPHQSYVQWSSVLAASTQLDPTIQMLDNSGNYVDYSGSVEIAAGQGFFCYANGATSALVFPQSAKTSTSNSNFNRTGYEKNYDLKLRMSSNINPYYHEIKIVYDNKATSKFDKGIDITFLQSNMIEAPSVTFIDGDIRTIRNHINTNENLVVMPLLINSPIEGNYTFELEGLFSTEDYSSAYLVDNESNKQYSINDAEPVALYMEANKAYNNYSLVLSKKKTSTTSELVDYNENVSIFGTSENINIKGNLSTAQEINVKVYNTIGQLVMEKSDVIAPNTTLSLSALSLTSDVYIVKVTTADGKQFTNRVVVAK